MCLSRNKKNNVYPCEPQFYYIKVGFKGVKITYVCFRDDLTGMHTLRALYVSFTRKIVFVTSCLLFCTILDYTHGNNFAFYLLFYYFFLSFLFFTKTTSVNN